MTGNNFNLDLVNINAHTKFGKILSINYQDMEWKRKKGHNSKSLRKMTGYNPRLDFVNINAYTKFNRFYQLVLYILRGKEILTSVKGHNSVTK